MLVLAIFALAGIPGQIPVQVLRDIGLAMYGAVVLWTAGVVALARCTYGRSTVVAVPDQKLAA
jgi:hypothetical protein